MIIITDTKGEGGKRKGDMEVKEQMKKRLKERVWEKRHKTKTKQNKREGGGREENLQLFSCV